MDRKDIIVIGASAGGVEVLRELVSRLPPDLRAAIFITLHLYERGESALPEVLTAAGPLRAIHPPMEASPIQPGVIYVAPPDYHLVLTPGEVHLGHGPRENLQRPCINVMFRSAAAAYGPRVAGVVLSGMLDDGAAGLWEIQQHGGVTIVQEPAEAAFSSMPESAIRGLNVQYILKVTEIAALITRLTMGNYHHEQRATAQQSTALTMQACPECGGVMKLLKRGELREYTCHTGHRFGLKTMIAEKSDKVERAMWTALSQSEELIDLLNEAKTELGAENEESLHMELTQRERHNRMLRDMLERQSVSSLEE